MEIIEKQYEATYNEEHILEFEEDLKILKELITWNRRLKGEIIYGYF